MGGASEQRVKDSPTASTRVVATTLVALLVGLCALGCGGGSGSGGRSEQTLFVRSSGSDGNDGTTPARALATLAAALERSAAGTNVIVGPGTYVPHPGSAAILDVVARTFPPERPVVFAADPTGALTGDAPGDVALDAQRALHGVRISRSSGIVIDGFVVTGVRGTNAAGVQIRSASADITIRNCEIRANDGDGIRIQASDRTLVFNNLIFGNNQRGLQLSGDASGSRGTRIINNTIARNGTDGISIGSSAQPTRNTTLRNNLVHDNAQRGIDAERDSIATNDGYDADYNLVFPLTRGSVSVGYGPLTPKGLHDLGVDPQLVAGYRLAQIAAGQPTDSPAVDAGDPATREPMRSLLLARTTATNDLRDTGVVDIGYHYPSVAPPTPVPTAEPGVTPLTPTATATATTTPTPTQQPPSGRLFVRANGDDGHDGSSPSQALRSIQHAVNVAPPDTEIIVGPGTYAGAVIISESGSPAEPMVLRGDPSGRDTGDPPGAVVLTSGGAATGVFVDGARYWTIEGLTITGAGIGVHVRRGAEGTHVRHNEIYGNADDGIRLQDAVAPTLFDNLIYCNGRRGILVAGASSGTAGARLVNNTIVGNADRGIFIGTATVGSTDTFLRNNLIQDNCGNAIQIGTSSLPGYDAQYNLVSPPTYEGTSAHPTDTAYDPATQGTVVRPARFVARAFCEAVCQTPGRDPNDFPTTPTVERHADDFRLAQTIAGQAPPDSVGVDAGDPNLAAEFVVPLRGRSTASNGGPDGGRIDIGYHFPLPTN